MRPIAALLAFGLLSPGAGSALADWRYTTWRMTPQAVVEASSGEAELLDPPVSTASGLTKAAVGRYGNGPFEFEVSFLFGTVDGMLELHRVVLFLADNSAAPQLYQSLVASFGEPDKSEIKAIQAGVSHTAQWRELDRNDLVSYFGIGDYYAVEYAPISPVGDDF